MVSQVVVVAGSSDELVPDILEVLAEFNVEPIRCQDIYSATAVLATSDSGHGHFVIGRVERLSLDKGRFLEKIVENENFCCCVSPLDQVMRANSANVFYVSQLAQVRELLGDWISRKGSGTMGRKRSFDRNEFATTDAEMEALLGGFE